MLKLFMMMTLLALVSCTEEISEELKNSETSDALTDAQKFTGATMTLEHKMPEELSYRMHKEGSSTIECSLAAPATGFSASNYYKSLDDYAAGEDPQVINCVLEAQELDLYQNGAELELTVDEFLCEYVTFEPFKYYTHPAGQTTRTLYELECEDTDCDSRCGNTYENIDLSTPGDPTFSGLVDPSTLNCYYDHTDNDGPNCDSGAITTIVFEMTGQDDPVPADRTCTDIWEQTSDVTIDECGGELNACLGGPSVDILDDPDFTTEIYENRELDELVLDFTIASPFSRISEMDFQTNMYIANYSRICSNMTDLADKNDASDYNGLDFQGKESEEIWRSNNYSGADSVNFVVDNEGNTLSSYTRDIGILDNIDGSTDSIFGLNIDTPGTGQEYGSIGYTENPWRGVHKTSSYYAFRCLDKAYDTKAQIRLYIREWDRAYSDTVNPASFALISDVYLDQIMDADGTTTNDGDDYNSVDDWDDFFTNPNGSATPLWLNNKCEETNTTHHFSESGFPGNI